MADDFRVGDRVQVTCLSCVHANTEDDEDFNMAEGVVVKVEGDSNDHSGRLFIDIGGVPAGLHFSHVHHHFAKVT